MGRNVLQIIQAAAQECGQVKPTTVVGNTSDVASQNLLALLIAVCEELSTETTWQANVHEYILNTAPGQNSYPLPADFLRILPSTEWDRSSGAPLYGPVTSSEWQYLKSGFAVDASAYRFRIRGNRVEILPIPTESRTLSFEYVSNAIAISANGSWKSTIESDADTLLFDDRLVINGLKLKYFEQKGFDTTAMLTAYNRRLAQVIGSDGGARVLSASGANKIRLLDGTNIPDGSWGGNGAPSDWEGGYEQDDYYYIPPDNSNDGGTY